jgi:hypothetical protein
MLFPGNCRGLGSRRKVESMKYLIKMKKTMVLLLQETKLRTKEVLDICNSKWNCSEGIGS